MAPVVAFVLYPNWGEVVCYSTRICVFQVPCGGRCCRRRSFTQGDCDCDEIAVEEVLGSDAGEFVQCALPGCYSLFATTNKSAFEI